jgi:hypothetical protein
MVDARQQAHQRRLAAPLGPTSAMRSPRSTSRSTRSARPVSPYARCTSLQLEHDAAGLGRVGELEADLLARRRDLDALDLVELLDAALHLARLGGLVAEAVMKASAFSISSVWRRCASRSRSMCAACSTTYFE